MFPFHSPDPSQAIILAGSGRSGTTWLGNIIAANPNVQTIFEPFDHRRVPQAAGMPLRPYVRSGESDPQWAVFVQRVLCGQIRNEWIGRQGNRWWASRYLIKEIRANLMLGWIDARFRPRIVFMTRHPCAVVLSRMKLKWETHLDVFLAQSQLVSDYLTPYLDLIRAADTELRKQAVMWCVENLVPLQQLATHNWVFGTYEELCRDPEANAERILTELGVRKTWFTRRAIQRVTMVTRPDSALLRNKDPVTAWQRELSDGEIGDVLDIVRAFGIELYGAEAMPNTGTVLKPSMQVA